MEKLQNQKEDRKKYYKIKYTLNILPASTYENGVCENVNELMDSLGATTELSVFDTNVVKDFYEFQWRTYAKPIHYMSAINHFFYVLFTAIYINEIYNNR
jgi:hypothetical protein